MIGLHTKDLRDLEPFASRRRGNRFIFLEGAGIDAAIAQLLHERIDAGLEHLRHQRAARVRLDFDLLAVLGLGLAHDLARRLGAHNQRIE